MIFYFILTLLIFLPAFFYLSFVKKETAGSDHYIHFSIIGLIKNNNNRFIKYCSYYLFQEKMTYPQFLHWILSFLSNKRLSVISKYIPTVFSFLSNIAFLCFLYFLIPHLSIGESESYYLLLSTALFVLTPYTYNIANAKNAGISARGMGLLLGQVYTYSLVLYYLSQSYVFLVPAAVSVSLAIFSSQFASQYIIFITPLLALGFGSITYIIPLLLGVLLSFVTNFTITSQFFWGNWGHKKFYSKFLAKTFILKYRYSVWKDLFWDFWVYLFKKTKPEGGGTLFMYIYTNPLVILIFSIPLYFPVLTLSSISIINMKIEQKSVEFALTVPLISAFLLFIIFSFRKTRFLGEPERYLEFVLGILSVTAAVFLINEAFISILILIYQFIFIAFQISLARLRNRKKGNIETNLLEEIDVKIRASSLNDDVRILSNNTETLRSLIRPERKIFQGGLYSEWYGKFHYLDIYYTFNHLKEDKIVPIIKEFKINFFVLDKGYLDEGSFNNLFFNKIDISKLKENESYILYKITY